MKIKIQAADEEIAEWIMSFFDFIGDEEDE